VRAGYAHWNARGHAIAASEMARYFEGSGSHAGAAPAAATSARRTR